MAPVCVLQRNKTNRTQIEIQGDFLQELAHKVVEANPSLNQLQTGEPGKPVI